METWTRPKTDEERIAELEARVKALELRPTPSPWPIYVYPPYYNPPYPYIQPCIPYQPYSIGYAGDSFAGQAVGGCSNTGLAMQVTHV